MKIAIPIANYGKAGGIERYIWEMSHKLAQNNEVHIFANKWKEPESKDIILHKVFMIERPYFLSVASFALFSTYLLKKGRFEIIYNHGGSLKQDLFVAHSCHKAWTTMKKQSGLLEILRYILNPFHHITLAMEGYRYKKGNYKKVIAVSNIVKNEIIEFYHLPSEDIETIYSGVNLEEFALSKKETYRKEIREAYNIKEEEILLLFVGNEFRRKGLEFIVSALPKVQGNVKLLVVGKGNSKRFCKRDVIFAQHSNKVEKFFLASDIFILPTKMDAFGLVVLEAMASGLPVIISNQAGASEIIKDGEDGLILKDYSNPEEIAQKINLLISDPNLRAEMGLKARKKAEIYSWDSVSEKTLEVFKAI
jgi:UDP-glucose:(heptosyl)LPS alpha-1,3-glucosyltransferase